MSTEDEKISSGEPPESSPAKPAAEEKPRKSGKTVWLALIIVVVVGMAVASYIFLLKPGPDQVVKQYLAAENAQDYKLIKTLLTKESAAMLPPDDQLPKPDPAKKQNMPAFDIGKAKTEGGKTSVPVTVQASQDMGMPAQTIDVIVVKEEGKWKIDLKATLQQAMEKAMSGGGMQGGPPPGGAGPGPGPSGPPPAESAPSGPPPAPPAAPPKGH
jgi:hypothetical protein